MSKARQTDENQEPAPSSRHPKDGDGKAAAAAKIELPAPEGTSRSAQNTPAKSPLHLPGEKPSKPRKTIQNPKLVAAPEQPAISPLRARLRLAALLTGLLVLFGVTWDRVLRKQPDPPPIVVSPLPGRTLANWPLPAPLAMPSPLDRFHNILQMARSTNDNDAAGRLLQAAMTMQSNDPYFWIWTARLANEHHAAMNDLTPAERWALVETIAGRALGHARGDAPAMVAIAEVLIESGLTARGVQIHSDAAALRPFDLPLQIKHVFLLLASGRDEQATSLLGLLVERFPAEPSLRVSLARQLLDLGHIEDASRQFGAALLMDPEDPNLAAVHANFLVALGRAGEAVTLLENGPPHYAATPDTRHVLGLAHLVADDNAAAYEHLLAAHALASGSSDAMVSPILLVHLAAAAEHEGRLDEAHHHSLLAIRQSLDITASAYHNLAAFTLENGGSPARARQYAGKACDILPDTPAHIESLARSEAALGRADKALALFNRAIETASARGIPLPPNFHQHHGEALAQAGDIEDALIQWQKGLSLQPGNRRLARLIAAAQSPPDEPATGDRE